MGRVFILHKMNNVDATSKLPCLVVKNIGKPCAGFDEGGQGKPAFNSTRNSQNYAEFSLSCFTH